MKDPVTLASRGFGFITFYKDSVARKLINEVQVTQMNGRKVDVRSAEPKLSEKIHTINKSVKDGYGKKRDKK